MKKMRRISIWVCTVLIAIALVGCSKQVSVDVEEEQARFEAFVQNEIKTYLEESYLIIHQTVSQPEVYGVNMDEVVVELSAPWTADSYAESVQAFEVAKKEFKTFDKKYLTNVQQNTYDIIKDQIEISEMANKPKFEYVGNVFGMFSGLHTSVPTVLTDFMFYSEKDVQDFITLMTSVKPLFDSYVDYAKLQKEAGTFMSDYNVDEIVAYRNKIIDEGFGNDMLEVIKSNINAYDGVSDDLKIEYVRMAEEAYVNSILPAYDNLATELEKLKDPVNNQLGLAHTKNGKELYELYYRMYTGSTLSIAEAEKLLTKQIMVSVTEMQNAIASDERALEQVMSNVMPSGYETYEDMIHGLVEWSKAHYSEIQIPEFEAVPASKLVSDGVGAYYVTPFIDKAGKNLIRVNTNNATLVDSLTTFYYVAHEGVPGHMYYYNYVIESGMDDYNVIVPTYLGFSEGFANYGAAYALDAAKTSDEMKVIMRANFDVNWAISALVDMGIHYRGWDLEELRAFLANYGMGEAAESLFYMTQSNPGVNLSYGVGYFEILELRKHAEKELKENFDEKQFNDALLQSGNAPFSIVSKNVKNYIKTTK